MRKPVSSPDEETTGQLSEETRRRISLIEDYWESVGQKQSQSTTENSAHSPKTDNTQKR